MVEFTRTDEIIPGQKIVILANEFENVTITVTSITIVDGATADTDIVVITFVNDINGAKDTLTHFASDMLAVL